MATLGEALDQIPIILKQRYNISKFWVPTANKILGEIEPFMEFSERKIIQPMEYFKNVVKYSIPNLIRKVTYVGSGVNEPNYLNDPDYERSFYGRNNCAKFSRSDQPWSGAQNINTTQGFTPYTLHGDTIVFSQPLPTNVDWPEFKWYVTDNFGGGHSEEAIIQLVPQDFGIDAEENQLVGTWLKLTDASGVRYDRYVMANKPDPDAIPVPHQVVTLNEKLPESFHFNTSDPDPSSVADSIYDYVRVEGFAKIDRFDPTIPESETDPLALLQNIPLKQEWERVLINGLRYYGETQMQATSGEAQRWGQIFYESIEDLKGDNWRNRGFQRLQQPSDWPTIG